MGYDIIILFLVKAICITLSGIVRKIQKHNIPLILLVVLLVVLISLYRGFI